MDTLRHTVREDHWMPYERSLRIEERFRQTISLIEEGCGNASDLSEALGVSRPTIHRIIAELKRRGNIIRSVHDSEGWCYEITQTPSKAAGVGK